MSEDLIKRSDAIKDLCDISNNSDMPNDWHRGMSVAISALYRVPPAPPADRPQGEWIRTGRTNIYGGIEVQCSNCGDKVMVQHLEDEWYCRHCGADMGMKGADDDNA